MAVCPLQSGTAEVEKFRAEVCRAKQHKLLHSEEKSHALFFPVHAIEEVQAFGGPGGGEVALWALDEVIWDAAAEGLSAVQCAALRSGPEQIQAPGWECGARGYRWQRGGGADELLDCLEGLCLSPVEQLQ